LAAPFGGVWVGVEAGEEVELKDEREVHGRMSGKS
jgi:hypothetical protein